MTTEQAIIKLVILASMIPVVTYAMVSVAVAVYLRCRPWPVALRGWGSAVMLVGYVIFNYDARAVGTALAIVLLGAALVVCPFIWRTAKSVASNRLDAD